MSNMVGFQAVLLILSAIPLAVVFPSSAQAAAPFAVSATGIKPVPDGRIQLDLSGGIGRSHDVTSQSESVRLSIGLWQAANLTLEVGHDDATSLIEGGSWTGQALTVQAELAGSWSAGPRVDLGPFFTIAAGHQDGTVRFTTDSEEGESAQEDATPYMGNLLYYSGGLRGTARATRWAAAVFQLRLAVFGSSFPRPQGSVLSYSDGVSVDSLVGLVFEPLTGLRLGLGLGLSLAPDFFPQPTVSMGYNFGFRPKKRMT